MAALIRPPAESTRTPVDRALSIARVRTIMARVLISLVGLLFVIYGAIAFVSPLPAGAPLVALGILMLALANPRARPMVRRLRRRFGWFDGLVRIVGGRTRGALKSVIEETAPETGSFDEARTPDPPPGSRSQS